MSARKQRKHLNEETRLAVLRQVREKITNELGWIGRDLDSKTKYCLRLAAETGVRVEEVQAILEELL